MLRSIESINELKIGICLPQIMVYKIIYSLDQNYWKKGKKHYQFVPRFEH